MIDMPLAADVGESFQRTLDTFFGWVPSLLGALIILIVGWIIARFVSRLVRSGLRAAGADRALATGTAGEYKQRIAPALQPSGVIATIAFWFVFGLAIMLAVSALGINALTEAIEGVVGYLPNIVAAALILIAAVAIAGAVGGVAQRLMRGTMLGKLVQTAVPVLVITIALFMALVQLKIATEIVVATYVIVLGSIGLGFALAFGIGGRNVADQILSNAYTSGQQAMPQLKEEARQTADQASAEADRLKEEARASGGDTQPRTGARVGTLP